MMRLPFLVLSALLLTACGEKKPFQHNDDIDASLREQIDSLNRQVIEGFVRKAPQQVLPLCSRELAAKSGRDLMSLIGTVGRRIDGTRYRVKDQFYARNGEADSATTVSTGTGEHDYRFTFTPVNKESYVTTGYFADSLQALSLITIWGKYGDEWKLNMLRIGSLEVMGLDAVGWYGKARQFYEKGDLVDAANALSVCALILQPATGYWHYVKEEEINAFAGKIKETARQQVHFPLTVTSLPTAPRIFQVAPEITRAGFLPLILYTTSIPMGDTAALSKECTALHSQVGSLFKGLDQNNQWILYRVYEHIPSGGDTVRNHGFVRATGK